VDDDQQVDLLTGGWQAAPLAAVRPRQARDLDNTLRSNDDVLQVEPNVGKCAQEAQIEGAGAGVALPALAGRHDFVHAVVGQCVEQSLEIAAIFGPRMTDPQALDGLERVGVQLPAEPLADWRLAHRGRHSKPQLASIPGVTRAPRN